MRPLLACDLSSLGDGDVLHTQAGAPLAIEWSWEADLGDVISLTDRDGNLVATIVVFDYKDPHTEVYASAGWRDNFPVFVEVRP